MHHNFNQTAHELRTAHWVPVWEPDILKLRCCWAGSLATWQPGNLATWQPGWARRETWKEVSFCSEMPSNYSQLARFILRCPSLHDTHQTHMRHIWAWLWCCMVWPQKLNSLPHSFISVHIRYMHASTILIRHTWGIYGRGCDRCMVWPQKLNSLPHSFKVI